MTDLNDMRKEARTWLERWAAQIAGTSKQGETVRVRSVAGMLSEVTDPKVAGYEIPMRVWRLFLIAQESYQLAQAQVLVHLAAQGGVN